MRKLVGIMLLILLAVPVSETFAGAGSWMMSQMHAQHALRKWDKQQAEFWKKFNFDMAKTEKQLDVTFPESAKGFKRIVSVGNSDDRNPNYACSVKVPQPEPKDLSSLAKIKADAAISAALNAYPGTVVTKLKLENENGCLVYSVHLNNGRELQVDAGKGTIIHSQATGSHEKQSEHEETGENED